MTGKGFPKDKDAVMNSLPLASKSPNLKEEKAASVMLKQDLFKKETKENHFIQPINDNLCQLEKKVEFFSFTIKEIEDIIKQ